MRFCRPLLASTRNLRHTLSLCTVRPFDVAPWSFPPRSATFVDPGKILARNQPPSVERPEA